MKVPYNWIKDFLPINKSVDEIAEILTLAGLEVDGILGTSFTFDGIITAKVVDVSKHPDSDRLQIAKVDTGKETLTIVCGAANCRKNLITALAPIGAKLKHPKSGTIHIQKTAIRGVESYGMLCSKEELGLEETSNGILELDEATPIGMDLKSLFFAPVFEISLTPNLGHCFSVLGVARELSYGSSFTLEEPKPAEDLQFQSTNDFSIQIESDSCDEFHLAKITNIQVGPSPKWLADRLKLSGMKSINNVVDALNYVMFELGQPMHAYDYDKIPSKKIIVKELSHTTPFLGLDSVLRDVAKDTLMIFSEKEPVAIAGIIGGHGSMVTEKTTTVLIEAAHFHPKKIRQGMKHLGFRTEAGSHFEKGIDRQLIKTALSKACELIQLTLTDRSSIEYASSIKHPFKHKLIHLRPARVNQIIGIQLSNNEIESILSRLHCKIVKKEESQFTLEIPSYRNDLNEEIDLVEEVARIFGFNNIEKSQGFYRMGTVDNHPVYEFEQKVKNTLLQLGLQEVITCNLISPKEASICLSKDLKDSQLISVLHAKSIDQSVLRPSLIVPLIQLVKRNLNFHTKNMALFEIGRVHFTDGGKPQEKFAIGILLSGNEKEHFSSRGRPYDFFSLKGIVESLLENFGVPYSIELSNSTAFHPGQQAQIKIEGEALGIFGAIHPSESKKLDVDVPTFIAQIDLIELMNKSEKIKKMHKLSEFPSSTRDVTLTINKITPYSHILQAIESVQLPILKQVECIDIFTSNALGSHKQNITLRMTYRSDEKTLDFETVEKGHQSILKAITPLTDV
jgi:phenylalanyl-tRNA synthetase beta chain